MRVNGTAVLGLAALGLAFSASTAGATTRCANPTGTLPCMYLQAAVDASAPGDTVTVNAGTYTGSALQPVGYIHVDVGKDGLKINGVGVVIIDPEFETGNNFTSLIINSNNVAVGNITFRNGDHGIAVGPGNTGITVSNAKFYGQTGDGVHFYGGNTNSKVTLSTFRGCDEAVDYFDAASDGMTITNNKMNLTYGIYGKGASGTITGNKIYTGGSNGIYLESAAGTKVVTNQVTNAYSTGIEVYGDNVTMMSNITTNTESTGIYVDGDNSIVSSNIITNAYSDGIEAYGSNLQVKTNQIKTTDSTGIYVSTGGTTGRSHNALISGNKITTYPGGDGIDLYYGNDSKITLNTLTNVNSGIYFEGGDNVEISSNTLTNMLQTGIDAYCYSQYDPGSGPCTAGTIKSNKITDVSSSYDGIYLQTSSNATGSFTLASNTVTRTGNDCFEVNGASIVATGNKGYDCGSEGIGDGFHVSGTDHTLSLNQIFRAAEDGFFVVTGDTSTTTLLNGNTSDHAGEDGFDVHANRVTLTSNKATFSNGSGFEIGDGFNTLSLTSNSATGNATGACISSTSTVTVGTNAFGTPDTPTDCNQPNGYIGN